MENEINRILDVYEKLNKKIDRADRFYVYENLAHLIRIQERHRATLQSLWRRGYHSFSNLRILDIGCGDGQMLGQYIQWGANPEQLAGIDLFPESVHKSSSNYPNVDVICGSASDLPWSNNSFDLISQHTVFTSILDTKLKKQVASEMIRVLAPGGAILWYDFMYNNPKNSNVKGINSREIHNLFHGLKIYLQKITLAPPIAKKIPAILLNILYPTLSLISVLRTHYLGVFIKPS